LGQGRDAVKQLFEDNPELSAEVEQKVFASFLPEKKEKA